jgi:hypothetical protein
MWWILELIYSEYIEKEFVWITFDLKRFRNGQFFEKFNDKLIASWKI